ncbi:hypothetical protein [Moorena sp. SIO4G3]|nr:hypothetical protein [Moorena sp. SIO4G3]
MLVISKVNPPPVNLYKIVFPSDSPSTDSRLPTPDSRLPTLQ